ncbi:MAG TPA: carboxypeptidase-like regulatory domain-containing protein [Vicinamibacterales bacterium]|nr:carboxypeptidase-like regulatory domain-containing protein [Vicinamibacterales bacterium]
MSVVVRFVRVLLAAFFIFLPAHPVAAQTFSSRAGPVRVRGVVLDAQRLPVKGAAVTIKLESGGAVRALESGADGGFDSGPLPAQSYVVDVRAPGFAAASRAVDAAGAIGFLAIDNLGDSQDPNTGVVMPDGTPAPIYRPEYGRTVRAGLSWSWAR